ncbi:MAG: hypothetical protein ACXVHK_11965, partial [Solirubrobacteraceae bacterium]
PPRFGGPRGRAARCAHSAKSEGAPTATLRMVFNETFHSEWEFHQRGFRELFQPSKGLLDPRQHLIAEVDGEPPGSASASLQSLGHEPALVS